MTISLTAWQTIALDRGMRLAAIVLVALLLNRLLRVVTNRLVQAAPSPTRVAQLREQQTKTLAGVLYSAGTVIILVGALLAALQQLDINVTPFAAIAGLASLAVGLGAQQLIGDLISGFFIVFEDQFMVGDIIRVGDANGRVEHLTLRRTLLRDFKGALVTIPNGQIRQVANLSRDWSQMFVDVTIPPDERHDRAITELERACAELRGDSAWSATLVDGPRVLGVEAITLEGTTLRIQVRTVPTRQEDVARELRRRIRARFEQAGVPLGGVQRVELAGKPEEASVRD